MKTLCYKVDNWSQAVSAYIHIWTMTELDLWLHFLRMPYLEFSNLSMSSPTFWASLCGCAPEPAGWGFGFGGGGGAGKGLEGAGGILLGFLSCPAASRCTGLGGTTDAEVQTKGEEQSDRKAWGCRRWQKHLGRLNKSKWENLHGCFHMLHLLVSLQNPHNKQKKKSTAETLSSGTERDQLRTSTIVTLPYFWTGCWEVCA